MPLAFVVAGMLFQAGSYGFMSDRFGAGHHVLFSAVAFALATVVFVLIDLHRRRRVPGHERRTESLIGPMVLVNVLTAVTFLGFFVSLAFIPAALAAALEVAVGPLAVAAIRWFRQRTRVAPVSVIVGVGLLVGCLVIAVRLDATSGNTAGGVSLTGWGLVGVVLAVVAGIATAALAVCFRELGRRKVSPVTVTAHRFHLTYVVAIAILAIRPPDPNEVIASMPVTVVLALAAVVIPLFLLQVGLQRADSMSAMAVLTTLPGVTYVAQVAFGAAFDPLAFGLICAQIAVATGYLLRWAPPDPVAEPPPGEAAPHRRVAA